MFVIRIKVGKIKIIPALPKLKRILGFFLIFFGVFSFLIVPTRVQINRITDFHLYLDSVHAQDSEIIRIDKNLVTNSVEVEDLPVRILIPETKIDLPIAPAKVVSGKWEVFDEKAGFGLGSSLPGQDGNTVVFAHAKKGQFLGLRDTKINDEILIFTDKQWFSYKITEIKEVGPKDTSVISPTTEATLTLFTCSGFTDSKRLIVVAKKMS